MRAFLTEQAEVLLCREQRVVVAGRHQTLGWNAAPGDLRREPHRLAITRGWWGVRAVPCRDCFANTCLVAVVMGGVNVAESGR